MAPLLAILPLKVDWSMVMVEEWASMAPPLELATFPLNGDWSMVIVEEEV